jgi:hypothetical protein
MVLCPPRCGKPGSNKISVKQGGRRQAKGSPRRRRCSPGRRVAVFSVAIQHSCAALQINVLDGFDGSGWSKGDAI